MKHTKQQSAGKNSKPFAKSSELSQYDPTENKFLKECRENSVTNQNSPMAKGGMAEAAI